MFLYTLVLSLLVLGRLAHVRHVSLADLRSKSGHRVKVITDPVSRQIQRFVIYVFLCIAIIPGDSFHGAELHYARRCINKVWSQSPRAYGLRPLLCLIPQCYACVILLLMSHTVLFCRFSDESYTSCS